MHHCHYVELPHGHVIYPAGAPAEQLYFVDSGLVSLIKTMEDGRSVEIGAVGVEGLVGVFAALGIQRPFVDYVIQVPAVALRVNRTTLRNEIARHEALRDLTERYLYLFVEKIAQTAACNRLHSLRQRCCRWLLLAHDNVPSDSFSFTHEFLASLLAVRRPSLSATANELQKQGLIRYVHGHVTVVDRPALEKASCECYRTIRGQIDAMFGRGQQTK